MDFVVVVSADAEWRAVRELFAGTEMTRTPHRSASTTMHPAAIVPGGVGDSLPQRGSIEADTLRPPASAFEQYETVYPATSCDVENAVGAVASGLADCEPQRV